MGEKLRNPPLVEALCEFRFSAGMPWNWTIPGQLYDKIKGEFPEQSQVQSMGVQLQAGPGTPPVATVHTGPNRVQLKRADSSAMVQVGENLLAVNHFPPYPQWEVFRALIIRMFTTYLNIIGKGALDRIGLRYINQIVIPKPPIEIGDLITLVPPLTSHLDRSLEGFYQRYEIKQDNPQGVLIHQTGIREIDGQPVIVVDLDFGSTAVQELDDADEIQRWLNAAHDRVYEAFVASLSPSLYERMKRGEE